MIFDLSQPTIQEKSRPSPLVRAEIEFSIPDKRTPRGSETRRKTLQTLRYANVDSRNRVYSP